jgi:hypothetical protein
MIVCLRAAAIASVMAVVASTSVMAQTTGTIPPQPPPYGVAPSQPPPTANQFSSNEIIDAAIFSVACHTASPRSSRKR